MDELAHAPRDPALADVRAGGRRGAARAAGDRGRAQPRKPPVATLAAAAAAFLYLLFAPQTADLAAASFRADLFAREGPTLFSTAWYGGHHTPGYSVLFPPLGALLGIRVLGALAAVAAVAAVERLAGRTIALLAVPAVIASLVSGRMPFTLGLAFGLGALLAAVRERRLLAGVAAVLTALASPVAALFTGLAGAAIAGPALWRRRGGPARGTALAALLDGDGPSFGTGVVLMVASAVPTAVLVGLFPEGGTFPFVVSAFVPCVLVAAAVAALAPPGPLRTGAVLYGLLCVAVFAVPSPIGGNAVRLGTLCAAPVAFWLLWPRRRLALALLALPLAYWILQPAVRDALRTRDDPSVRQAFHKPLTDFLARRQPARIEIPLTQNHWEARWVADDLPIARGWLRQVDRERNALFYEGTLTAERYRRWLDENAIAYVALPLGLPLDASAEREFRLVRDGLPYLREIGRPGRWRVFAVEDARPLAEGAAALERITPDGFVVRFARPGTATVRIRHTPFWRAEGARVERAPGGWTRVTSDAAGTTTIRAGLR